LAIGPGNSQGLSGATANRNRGQFLYFWGSISLILVGFSICGGIPGIIGLAIAIPVWVASQRDLAMMDKGLMDPEGATYTAGARDRAIVAVLVIAVFLLVIGAAISWSWLTN
jgi:hypothetical protein